MADSITALLLLFDKPQEPCFMPRGDKNYVFDVPKEYLPEKYNESMRNKVMNTFDTYRIIKVQLISLPSLNKELLDFARDENFTLFLPKHRRFAAELINKFVGMKNLDDVLSMAVYARDRVNPYLFNYALAVALLHRPDSRNLDLPSFVNFFPDKFMDARVFRAARETAFVVPMGSRTPIEIPNDHTASDLEEEHRLAYFREDLGVNLHHWHWHLVYPTDGDEKIMNKDRRGELFYYMHQQIIARYNFERLCNKLRRVERLTDWNGKIKEAYFPKLESQVTNRSWPARVANQRLSNLRREVEDVVLDIDDLKRWRDRVFEAINTGVVIDDKGNTITLTEHDGINILGNIIESSSLSPNRGFYGDLHSMGHLFLAFIHDPDHRHLESSGVMGDLATAMRDPIFYRWHAYIDDLFQKFKSTLRPYSLDQLNYQDVTVEKISIQSNRGENIFSTFWQQSNVDLARGLDFQKYGAVFVKFTHLQHESFSYNIVVNNASKDNKEGTCRIFLSPSKTERNNSWKFKEQKLMFIELDKFSVDLKPGKNHITRKSTESSVTIPFERTFRNLDNQPTSGGGPANFCGCGWPQHMLIPKGTTEGMPCQLFVMISNYADDKVEQDVPGASCKRADSFCGIRDKKYPDRRSMGYPFDRQARDGVATLSEFLTPNMRVQDVTIMFKDKIIPKSEDSGASEGKIIPKLEDSGDLENEIIPKD